ncbi:MAG: hypothetical protein NTU63_00165 [Candidatus Pacearchaeota archaeon]|nr:hypothetical protein [Candidatus Pacearchaeota archaeon]
MFIFDFFKRKKKEEQPAKEKIRLDSINLFVNNELKNLNEKSEGFKSEMIKMISQFSSEIKQKIPELKMLNLDNRREEQRLKEIVMTNLYDYISYLEKLIEDLEKIEPKEIELYIRDIQSVFNRFSKNSRRIYDKVTILIGKEIAEVRNITKKFAKEFNEKLTLNKENFEKINLIKTLQDKLIELEEAKKIQNQIENSTANFKQKIAKIEEKKQLTEKNYEEYKKSNESKKFIEEQGKIKQENKIINEDVLKLKREFNLKDLAKNFHNDSKKNSIIKKYSENFYDSLKEDSIFEIISLLKETNKKFDEEKIKTIRQKVLEQKNLGEDSKTKEFNSLLSNLESELKEEHDENENENEKILKFESKKKQILTKIEEMGKKIWNDFKI